MKAFIVVIAAAMIVVAALAAFAPASLVDARVASATGGQVRIAEAEGTLWRGRGLLAASDGRWRIPVAWRVDIASLPRGVASIELGSEDVTEVRGNATVLRDRVVVESLDAELPASMLGAMDPAASVFTGGELKLRARSLALDSQRRGTIDADWSGARVQAGALRVDLGTVTMRLAAQGATISGPVASKGGDVAVEGTLVLLDERLDANLRLTPTATASAELRNALASLGPADGRGTVALRIARTLR